MYICYHNIYGYATVYVVLFNLLQVVEEETSVGEAVQAGQLNLKKKKNNHTLSLQVFFLSFCLVNEAETICWIARILGILQMNCYNSQIFAGVNNRLQFAPFQIINEIQKRTGCVFMISKVGNVNNKKIMLEKQKLQASTSYFSQDISIFFSVFNSFQQSAYNSQL